MDEKKTIHEAIRAARFTENVELIDVPTRGEGIVLLRSREMPLCAFVMWKQIDTTTLSQMVLASNVDQGGADRRIESRYSVVCACCASERYGIEEPGGLSEKEQEKWFRKMAGEFRDQLVRVALENGIRVVFMRRASAWGKHYGDTGGLMVVEACYHLPLLFAMYPRELIKRELRFIDYRRSGGLEDIVKYSEL